MLAVAALIWYASTIPSQAKQGTDYSRPELVAEVSRYEPGKPFLVGIHFAIKPGWHVYWRNPGDSGQEIRVTWKLPPGWKASELMWPRPSVLTDTGLTMYVYAKEVTLLARLTPVGTGSARISAHLDWLVCKDICLPAKKDLSLTLTSSTHAAPNRKTARLLAKVAASLPSSNFALRGQAVLGPKEITAEVALPPKEVGKAMRFQFLPYDMGVVRNQPRAEATQTRNLVALRFPKSEYFKPGVKRLRGLLVWKGNSPPTSFFHEIDLVLKPGLGEQP
ncbi:MAG TPA: protein-disulfide reductase DsbD domain-containing protein, partial [Fimbriimonadaceae bacterium]|nr:protein-disulfide reductase DsbD domain-containing protein [Fimbriimonadaceae bacterium]